MERLLDFNIIESFKADEASLLVNERGRECFENSDVL